MGTSRLLSVIRNSRTHEVFLYALGLAYSGFSLTGLATWEYAVVGALSLAVGLSMRLPISRWVLRYLKAMVFTLYGANFLIIGYVGFIIHGFTVSGMALVIGFTLLFLLTLAFIYCSLRGSSTE